MSFEKPSRYNAKSAPKAEMLEDKEGFSAAANAYIEATSKANKTKKDNSKDVAKSTIQIASRLNPLTNLLPDDLIQQIIDDTIEEGKKRKSTGEKQEQRKKKKANEAVEEKQTQEKETKINAVSEGERTDETKIEKPEGEETKSEKIVQTEQPCYGIAPVNIGNHPLVTFYMCPRCIHATSQRLAINYSNHSLQTMVFCSKCIEVNKRLCKIISI